METVPAEDVKSEQSPPGLSQVKDLVNGSIPPLKTKGIKFGHLNIHSLVKKIDSLRILLKNKPFDVISFNETLCDFTVSDSEIAIDGFNIFRRDRNRHGGGVAVYVTETFNAKRRQDLESDDLENVWVEMCYPHKSPILVGSFYRPPSAVYDFNSEFEKNIDCVSHVGMDCIILGDFNYDQTPPVRDTHCCNFLFHTTCNGFTQLIATPTRVTNHSNTLIDLIFVTNPNMYRDYGVFLTCISDHFLIYAVRDFNENTNLTGECIEYRSFKHLDEQKFKDDLGNVPWEAINDIDDVDVALDTWISLFMAVVDDHVPLRKKRLRKNPCPWITDEIVGVMKQRDRIHRAAIEMNEIPLWDEYKMLRNKVNHMLSRQKSEYYRGIIRDCSRDSKKVWNCLKKIVPSSKKTTPLNLKVNGEECTTSSDIADAFNQYFVSSVAKICADVSFCDSPFSEASNKLEVTFDLEPVSVEFVINEVHKMNSSKATGDDDISCRLLKLACPIIAQSLTKIINLSIVKGYVPYLWKSAKVLPLYKSGDHSCLGNYRPISVLPVVSKILERAVHYQLSQFISDHNLLHPNQSGFRPLHSTTTALAKLVNLWSKNTDDNKLSGVAFIDLRKAFDTVNHEFLLKKLRSLGCSINSVRWFKSYLSDRTQRVFFKGANSPALNVCTGVPQGSILGPLLFSIYVNDMPGSVTEGVIDMYADDTTLTVSGTDACEVEEKLSNGVSKVMKWVNANRLVVNLDKTSVMLIGPRAKLNYSDDFKVNVCGTVLKRVKVAKCLGLLIDEELSWKDQIEKVTKTVQSKLCMLRRVKQYVPTHSLLLLYNSFVQPHFDYCAQIWSNRFKMQTNKLEKLHKRAARIILSKNYDTPSSELFRELNWLPLNQRFDYLRAVLMYKCVNNLAPAYLMNDLTSTNQRHNYNTRHALNSLVAPRFKTECFKHSPLSTGITVWNNLDQSVKSASSLTSFKSSLKSFLQVF